MNKQQEIEKMEFIISTTVHDCEQKDCIRNCQFARQKDCKYFRAAKGLQAEGYGDVRAAVKEFAEKFKTRFFFIMATNMRSPIYQCTGDEIDRLVNEVCGDGH